MSKLTTKPQRDRWGELLSEATPRPWRVSMSGYSVKSLDVDIPIIASVPGGVAARAVEIARWLPNADLIAEAPAAMESLLAENARLREMVKQALEAWSECRPPALSASEWPDAVRIAEFVGELVASEVP